MKRILKLTAAFLSAIIMVQSFSSVALAAENTQTSKADQTTSEPDWSKPGLPETEDSPDAQIISEVEGKRTENSKTFLLDDGTYMVASYDEPVHYKDSAGTWQDIDNTMSVSNPKALAGAQVLENKAGSTRLKLSKTIKPGNTVTLNVGNAPLTWGLDGVSASASQMVTADSASTESHNDRFLNLKKLHNETIYKNALPGVDVQYKVSSVAVKENIILNSKDTQKQFTETYQIGNLTVKQKDDKSIELFEKSDSAQKNAVYTISAPLMMDADGEISDGVSLRILQQTTGTLQVAVNADEAWLNDQSRKYPVSIDPRVDTKKQAIRDTFISSGEPDSQLHGGMGSMFIGNEASYYKTCRVLVDFDLPQLSKGDMVVKAQLNIKQYPDGINPSTGSMQINAYEMGSAWDEVTATWNNTKAATDTAKQGTLIDYFNASQDPNKQINSWDITKTIKKWYVDSSGKHGFLLAANDEAAAVRDQYYASENMGANPVVPGLTVQYVSNIGLEDYWGYHSQPAGRAGTGSVNDYTGNLVFSTPIMSTTGARAPLDFSLTYNGYQSGSQFGNGQYGVVYGLGWQSNLNQRIDPVTNPDLSGTYKYVYTDEDGTQHYFTADPDDSTKFNDEDGLGLELTVGWASGRYYTLRCQDGSKKTFTQYGYLFEICDSNNNMLTLTYDGYMLSSVKDGAGRITTISSVSGKASSITGQGGKQVLLHYTGENLTSITYPDGKEVDFSYDSENRLQSAMDQNGTYNEGGSYHKNGSYLQYSYYGSSGSDLMVKNRVKDVAEYSKSGDIGNKVVFTYNPDNTTTFQYVKAGQSIDQASRETYNFDNFGRATSVVNADGSASVSAYTSQSTTDGSANKMTGQSSTSAPVINILKDHNAELNNGTWIGSNWSSPGGVFSVDGSTAYLGAKSLKITQSQTNPARSGAEQTVTGLVPGLVYTLSGYVKTSGVSGNQGAGLYVAAFNGSTQLSTVTGRGLFGNNDWQRLSVTFTVPAGATRVLVYGGLIYANGTAWFDCLQLETGSAANPYNLLENSDFRYNASYQPLSWSASHTTSGDGMSGGWLRIGGVTTLEKTYYQAVAVNRPAATTSFSVSGKAKGKSVPTDKDGRYYAIDLGIAYTDGTVQWNIVPFYPDSSGEQYTSGTAISKDENKGKTISAVGYYIIYYKNANEAFFKNLQLGIDNSQVSYIYDSNGNLKSAGQNGQGSDAYTYTGADELDTVTEADGDGYTYAYDENNAHRVISSRSKKTGSGTNYAYDDFGNVTNVKEGTVQVKEGTTDGAGPIDLNSPYFETSQTYDSNGNYVLSDTDQRGKTTAYDIDPITGTTDSVKDPNGNTTYYDHDPNNEALLTSVRAQSSAGEVKNTYGYDTGNNLNRITHNGFDYTFTRDGFGNTTEINAGTQNLLTNGFAAGNGNLLTSTFGNGFILGYGYDSFDRVTSISKNGQAAYQYVYDARGNLAKIIDKTGGSDATSTFDYDVNNRLIQKTLPNGVMEYLFDDVGRPTGAAYTFAGQSKGTSFAYGPDDRKGDVSLLSGGKITRSYDSLSRENSTDVTPIVGQDVALRAARDYVSVSGYRTTSLIGTYTNSKYKPSNGTATELSKYEYTYDENGNILTAADKDGKITKYTYDALNQLIRADDQKAGVSTTYSYDAGGNIAAVSTYAYTTDELGTPTDSTSYIYGNGNWKDLLTNYNGEEHDITYDAIGNPLFYREGTDGRQMQFTWEGRQLKTAVANGKNLSYAYNDNGIRTGKTVAGVTTNYFLDESTVIAQQTGSDILWFLYDSDGTRVGFTYNGTAYYYTTNAQGDVTGITDSSCNTVVEYTYDAWGKLLSTTGSLAGTIGKINPFLYRGYYYDSETGLYYLNSRYYDPQTGRFLNADDTDLLQTTQGNLLTYNLFAYGNNNPVINSDPSGYLAIRSDVLATAIDLAITLFTSGMNIKYFLKLLKSQPTKYLKYIMSGTVKLLSRFQVKLFLTANVIKAFNSIIGVVFSWSIGKGVTWVLSKVFRTETRSAKQYVWWGKTIKVQYIIF